MSFRIGRKHASHTYPEPGGIGGRRPGAVLVFGAPELVVGTQFLPPGFGGAAPAPNFDIEMPFAGNFVRMVVRQNTAGSGVGNVTYRVLLNGNPTGLFLAMGPTDVDKAVAAVVPFGPGADNAQRISLQAVVAGSEVFSPPSNVTVTVAF